MTARGRWPQSGAVVVVSVWPDQLHYAVRQMLRQIMGGKTEGVSHSRISATADLGSQQNDAGIRTLWVHPSVIMPITVNSGDDGGLISCRKANG